jgi:polyisoprenoid-binding protein YceI
MSRPAALLLIFLVAAPLVAAERFVVDGEHSRIGFSVAYDFMVLGELEGEFREFAGEVAFDRSSPTDSSIWVEIVTTSVDTRFAARDLGLKSDDYLAVATYPTALFRSREVIGGPDGMVLLGELTMRGITNPVEIEFDLLDLGDALVVHGRSLISREAFNVSGPDLSGDVMISDQVSLILQMVFRRESAEG